MSTDAALDLLAGLVLEDGRRWGDAAVSVQVDDTRAVLDVEGPPYHFLTRARGYSKTSDLAGVAIAVMLAQLPAGSRLYGLAADRDQGRLLVDAIAGYVARTPGLVSSLRVDAFKVTAASGSVLEVLAADAPSAWGLRPAFLIVDEVANWASTAGPKALWEATSSALAKVPGARLVVLTSAGDPAHWSRSVLDHAYRDDLWRVHEVAGPPPWADPVRLAEQRRRLLPSVYARLFENRWVASEDRLVSSEELADAVALPGPVAAARRGPYVLGVDVGLRHDRTAVVVCHGEPAAEPAVGRPVRTRVVVDHVEVLEGTRESEVSLASVEGLVFDLSHRYRRARVRVDPWQAVGVMQRLRTRGVPVVEVSFTPKLLANMATTLFTLLRDRLLRLPDDQGLVDELGRVRLRESGSTGLLRIDHEAGAHDDRVTALGLAATGVLDGSGWTTSVLGGVNTAVPFRYSAEQFDQFKVPMSGGNLFGGGPEDDDWFKAV